MARAAIRAARTRATPWMSWVCQPSQARSRSPGPGPLRGRRLPLRPLPPRRVPRLDGARRDEAVGRRVAVATAATSVTSATPVTADRAGDRDPCRSDLCERLGVLG